MLVWHEVKKSPRNFYLWLTKSSPNDNGRYRMRNPSRDIQLVAIPMSLPHAHLYAPTCRLHVRFLEKATDPDLIPIPNAGVSWSMFTVQVSTTSRRSRHPSLFALTSTGSEVPFQSACRETNQRLSAKSEEATQSSSQHGVLGTSALSSRSGRIVRRSEK